MVLSNTFVYNGSQITIQGHATVLIDEKGLVVDVVVEEQQHSWEEWKKQRWLEELTVYSLSDEWLFEAPLEFCDMGQG